ncbi:diguanylate cyclase [Oscillibacter sp.]|uniref:sensor domain-containing diguanylate cyclase n=1 Tax=Oscillibacter sp. TaxID=1945593 RepID=UPI0028A90DF9|nr:diguanylate cyclase [Oscillibacter sp.]
MPQLFILAVALSVVISIIMVVFTIANHTVEKSLYLILLTVGDLFFSFGNLLEITAPTLETAFYGVRVQYLGAPLLVPLAYLFFRDFYGKKRFSARRHVLIFSIPVVSMVSLQLYPLVRLHYSHIWYSTNGQIASIQHTDGIVYLLGVALNYICIVLGLSLILSHIRNGSKVQRRQSFILLLSCLAPLASNFSFVFFRGRQSYDFTPIAYVSALAVFLYSALTQNLLNVLPLARAQVIDGLEDAFIICDSDFHFLDANQSAKRLFPQLACMVSGESLEGVQGFKPEGETLIWKDGEARRYKITANPVLQGTISNGICIVFRDVTVERHLLDDLHRQATTDALTGVYNRGTFFDYARQTFAKGGGREALALLMIDVDHFKQVNDTYGHPCGDAVLKTIAQAARAHFRKSDLVGRYGGEEFAILLEDLSSQQAVETAEQFRRTIEELRIAYRDRIIRVAVSIGVAHCPAARRLLLEELLNQADAAMYLSKAGGRNRTSLYRGDKPVV